MFSENLKISNDEYQLFSLNKTNQFIGGNLIHLPYSLRILLENMLRSYSGNDEKEYIGKIKNFFNPKSRNKLEINFYPSRVLMQDFTGVPAIVDLASMRDALKEQGKNPNLINPLVPVDLVIDHSLSVERYGDEKSFQKNVELEFKYNQERYKFLRWAQNSFKNLRVVPPGQGICHQINLEYLAQIVCTNDKGIIYPDTVVGTDSHTTMINALGVLGWGVGGIEAESVMLSEPISMLVPQVVGVELIGKPRSGVTATDLALTIVEMLRKKGVVGKFVEFYGSGVKQLNVSDRATISNMAPEYGATCGFFPVDEHTIEYLKLTNRSSSLIDKVESYTKQQSLWNDYSNNIIFDDTVSLDLSSIGASIAGPSKPQQRLLVNELKAKNLDIINSKNISSNKLTHGSVVVAAITSCTNTSNPTSMIMAGLLAKKAVQLGLVTKPWVKTSLAPGSWTAYKYLEINGLQEYLDILGFNLVGYGCTTCIGNSGQLNFEVSDVINKENLLVSAVLSGNRNFEGRIHPLVKANWLMSPPLVVAYAIAGTTLIDLYSDSISTDYNGKEIYLKDIWPESIEIQECLQKISKELFQESYKNIFLGNELWQNLPNINSDTFDWDDNSSYICKSPFFDNKIKRTDINIKGARLLALFGDSVTTDHISPAGKIPLDSPAGKYLVSKNISLEEFNSYGSRRGNHNVMVRGSFANIRIRNKLCNKEGGYTRYIPNNEEMSIYDAARKYDDDNVPLIIIAGTEYGTGSSRDWAAKGTLLLGVRAVIAESFERIHRSNLIQMGILPLQLKGISASKLNLDGRETFDIIDLSNKIGVNQHVEFHVNRGDSTDKYSTVSRIDTVKEIECFVSWGILPFVLQNNFK